MKKLFLCSLAIFSMVVLSCTKDDPAPALPTAPEALAEHDNKSGGIYRGTIATVNNSGSFNIILQNGKKELVMRMNGMTRTLTSNDLDSWTSGQQAVAILANGSWVVSIDINPTGTAINISFSLDGVTEFNGALAKELSTAQVKVYEGTFAGDDSGRWNFISQGTTIQGVYVTNTDDDTFAGTIAGSTINITSNLGYVTAVGSFAADGNSATGTWTGIPVTNDGTWTGSRVF